MFITKTLIKILYLTCSASCESQLVTIGDFLLRKADLIYLEGVELLQLAPVMPATHPELCKNSAATSSGKKRECSPKCSSHSNDLQNATEVIRRRSRRGLLTAAVKEVVRV